MGGLGVGDTFRSTGAAQGTGAPGTSTEADLDSFARGTAEEGVFGDGIQGKWKGKDREQTQANGETQKQDAHTQPIHNTSSGGQPFENAWASSITTSSSINNYPPPPDGHAVSSLLSDPLFQPLSDPSDTLDDLAPDQDTQPNPFLPPPPPPPPQTTSTQDTNPTQAPRLALVPGLDTTPTATIAENNPDALLTTLSDVLSLQPADSEANQPWLSLDALYHDAVYGNYIEPYVRSAAEEVRAYDAEQAAKKLEGDGNDGENEGEEEEERLEALRQGKAVRRLQMVLGHLRREMVDGRGGQNVR